MSSVTPARRWRAASRPIRSTTFPRPDGADPCIVAFTTGHTAKRSRRESAMTFAFGAPPWIAALEGDSVYQFGARTSTRPPTSPRRFSAPGTAE